MTKSKNRSFRSGQNSQPPCSQISRSTQPASSKPSDLPASRRVTRNHADSAQLPPTTTERHMPPPGPPHIDPLVPPRFSLEMLIDPRLLSTSEFDRLRNEIVGRDDLIAEQQRIIETQRCGLLELSELSANRQRTIMNQRESNTTTLKALENQKRSNAGTNRVLGQLRRETATLKVRLKGAGKETARAVTSTHHLQAMQNVQPEADNFRAKQRDISKEAADYPKEDARTDQADAFLPDLPSEVVHLRQELTLAATRHKAVLTDLERRESLAQAQLKEAEVAIAISKAKMPELVKKASQVDQLMRDLHVRNNIIEDLSSLVEESCATDSTQSELIRTALNRQTSIHDLVVQDYTEQIRELTSQKLIHETKANKAIALCRHITDAMVTKIPWQELESSLPELKMLEQQLTTTLNSL